MVFILFSHLVQSQKNEINAILADSSWIEKFGRYPNDQDEEHTRIRTHLEYVLAKLESSDIHREPPLNLEREKNIQRLKDYISASEFPQLDIDTNQRVPCFRDNNNRLCAVAYLVERSGNTKLVDQINSEFKYDLLANMESEDLQNWQANSGFSFLELQMIQPAYDFLEPVEVKQTMVFQDPENKLYGVKSSKSGRVYTKAKYQMIHLYMLTNGLGMAMKDSLWAIVDKKGRKKSKFQYEAIKIFENSKEIAFVAAKADGKFYVFNEKARLKNVIECDDIYFSNSSFAYIKKGQHYGVVSNYGDHIIPCEYGGIQDSYDHFIVYKDGFSGVLDKEGQIVVPLNYSKVSWYKLGFKAELEDQVHIYNTNGERSEIQGLQELKEYGNAFHDRLLLGKKDGKWGLIASDLNWYIAPEHDSIYRYIDFHVAKKDGKWAYYSNSRQLLFPFEYSHIQYTLESFVVKAEDKMGLLSLGGETLIPVKQDSVIRLVGNLSGGINYCYAVLNGHKWKLYNNQGELISKMEFDDVGVIDGKMLTVSIDGKTYVGHYYRGELKLFMNHPFQLVSKMTNWNSSSIYKKNGKFGLIKIQKFMNDSPGIYTTEPIYDSLITAPLSDMYICKQNGNWGIVNSKGEEVLKAEYEYFSQRDWYEQVINYLVFYKENDWHCVDRKGTISNCHEVGIVPGSANESVRKL